MSNKLNMTESERIERRRLKTQISTRAMAARLKSAELQAKANLRAWLVSQYDEQFVAALELYTAKPYTFPYKGALFVHCACCGTVVHNNRGKGYNGREILIALMVRYHKSHATPFDRSDFHQFKRKYGRKSSINAG